MSNCQECKDKVMTFAIALAGLSVGAILAMNAEVAIIGEIAYALGVDAADVAAIIPKIASAFSGGANAIATAICFELGKC